MSKRLQVLLEERELKEIQRIAREQRVTVAERVRQSLRNARLQEPLGDAGRKLEAVRARGSSFLPDGGDRRDARRDRARLPTDRPALIFVDSNIPMYLVGAAHPHKADAQRLLERLISERRRSVTDAEVLQEILHRYVAIRRRDAIQPAFDVLLGVVDQVFPVDRAVVDRAKAVVLGTDRLSARDAIHLAVMQQQGITQVLSFDAGFDGLPGIERLTS